MQGPVTPVRCLPPRWRNPSTPQDTQSERATGCFRMLWAPSAMSGGIPLRALPTSISMPTSAGFSKWSETNTSASRSALSSLTSATT